MKKFVVIVITAVVGVIVVGFFLLESPASLRSRQFDEQRIMGLQNLNQEIKFYWYAQEKLPESLPMLDSRRLMNGILPVDPESGLTYVYEQTSSTTYKFCANFSSQNLVDSIGKGTSYAVAYPAPYSVPYYTEENWTHDSGYYCFTRTIIPEQLIQQFGPKPVVAK